MPHIADKGHAGPGTTAPVAELPGLPLSEADKNLNRAIERIRWRIEQVIAHIKTRKPSKPVAGAPSTPFRTPSQQHSEILFTYTL